MFLGKGVKVCCKFTGEHPSDFSELLCNVIEIALRHGCSPVNLLHVVRTPFPKNSSEELLLLFENDESEDRFLFFPILWFCFFCYISDCFLIDLSNFGLEIVLEIIFMVSTEKK